MNLTSDVFVLHRESYVCGSPVYVLQGVEYLILSADIRYKGVP